MSDQDDTVDYDQLRIDIGIGAMDLADAIDEELMRGMTEAAEALVKVARRMTIDQGVNEDAVAAMFHVMVWKIVERARREDA